MKTKGIRFLAVVAVLAMVFAAVPMLETGVDATGSSFDSNTENQEATIEGITYKITEAYVAATDDAPAKGKVKVTAIDFGDEETEKTVPKTISPTIVETVCTFTVVAIELGDGEEYKDKTIIIDAGTACNSTGGATVKFALDGITYKITEAYVAATDDAPAKGQVGVIGVTFEETPVRVPVSIEAAGGQFSVTSIDLSGKSYQTSNVVYVEFDVQSLDSSKKGGATVTQIVRMNIDPGRGLEEHFYVPYGTEVTVDMDTSGTVKFYKGEKTDTNHIVGKDLVNVYTGIYEKSTEGMTLAGLSYTMTENVDLYFRNMNGAFFNFYLDTSYDCENNGAWFYAYAADGRAGTAFQNIIDDENNKINGEPIKKTWKESGDNWIYEADTVQKVTTSAGAEVPCGTGYYYLSNDNTWKSSLGLNRGESNTFFIELTSNVKPAGYDQNTQLFDPDTLWGGDWDYYYLLPNISLDPTVVVGDTVGQSGTNSTFTFEVDPTKYANANGYGLRLVYDSSKLTFESSESKNLLGSGDAFYGNPVSVSGNYQYVTIGFAQSADSTTSTGIFKAVFTLNVGCADPKIPLYYFVDEISAGDDKAVNVQMLGVAYILTGAETVSVGQSVPITVSKENLSGGEVTFTFDTAAFRFDSANGSSVSISDGKVIVKSSGDVSAKFVVKDGAKPGMTAISFNGNSSNYLVNPSAYVVTPIAASVSDSASVRFYELPAISVFELVYAYAGGTPEVSRMSALPDTFLSIVNVDKVITIRWAAPTDTLVNGNVLSIKGVTGLTLTGSEFIGANGENYFATSVTSLDLPVDVTSDLNGDGKADLYDLIVLMKVLANIPAVLSANADCDFNGDGTVDILDAMVLVKAIA